MAMLATPEFTQLNETLSGLTGACRCENSGCRSHLTDLATRLAALLGLPPQHPAAFRFDDDATDHDPTGEWIDQDEDGWTLDGWLYPATGERPIPLMRMTREGDATINGPLDYLPDLINQGAHRAESED